ncbi:MAG: hypothetical protein LKE76_07440 [Atopobiaceae bacterium]|nr:hypothetical protein [Atopobiaceae bacterium]MCI1389586.1 hypothetical protein [Atopobiaceae bacterium]
MPVASTARRTSARSAADHARRACRSSVSSTLMSRWSNPALRTAASLSASVSSAGIDFS